ncbi:uncharacterized protein [Ptychodera flava]|uniref:uncharacterized protein n=1 Tax=Ptychodera flava TaxID=63121 RepID=UPI00396A5456
MLGWKSQRTGEQSKEVGKKRGQEQDRKTDRHTDARINKILSESEERHKPGTERYSDTDKNIENREGQDVTIDSYSITTPSDPAQISYNRVTDTTITFTVTVNSGSSGGDIDGIDVAFYDISDTKIAGTEQAAGGTAPTSGNPTTIAASQTGFAMNGNTVTIKFSNEDACTAVDYLCAQIKGTGVVTNSARHCISLGRSTGEAGGKDCNDPPTSTPHAMSTDESNPETTSPMSTPGTLEKCGADAVAAYLAMPLLMSFVLAMHMVMTV